MIYHIASSRAWAEARKRGFVAADSLSREGFIHCSTREQVLATANEWFAGCSELLLLGIDEGAVAAEIRYEDSEGDGRLFPHVFGVLELGAVVWVRSLSRDPDGCYAFPAAPDSP